MCVLVILAKSIYFYTAYTRSCHFVRSFDVASTLYIVTCCHQHVLHLNASLCLPRVSCYVMKEDITSELSSDFVIFVCVEKCENIPIFICVLNQVHYFLFLFDAS